MNRILAIAILIACALMPNRSDAAPAPKTSNNLAAATVPDDLESTTAFLTLEEGDGIPSLANEASAKAEEIIDYAAQFLGRPYRRGAKGPSSFDCSGFTSFVCNKFGLDLSSSSSAQYTQGESVSTDEVRPGDLLFFTGRNSRSSRVGHVALVVDVDDSTGEVKFIHAASSGIQYSKLRSDPYYASRYIGARRVIGD